MPRVSRLTVGCSGKSDRPVSLVLFRILVLGPPDQSPNLLPKRLLLLVVLGQPAELALRGLAEAFDRDIKSLEQWHDDAASLLVHRPGEQVQWVLVGGDS